jgi:hypothetical protein
LEMYVTEITAKPILWWWTTRLAARPFLYKHCWTSNGYIICFNHWCYYTLR